VSVRAVVHSRATGASLYIHLLSTFIDVSPLMSIDLFIDSNTHAYTPNSFAEGRTPAAREHPSASTHLSVFVSVYSSIHTYTSTQIFHSLWLTAGLREAPSASFISCLALHVLSFNSYAHTYTYIFIHPVAYWGGTGDMDYMRDMLYMRLNVWFKCVLILFVCGCLLFVCTSSFVLQASSLAVLLVCV